MLHYNDTTKQHELGGGISDMLFKTISKHFNITYEVINCNGVWGVKPINGTWPGVVGKLINKV